MDQNERKFKGRECILTTYPSTLSTGLCSSAYQLGLRHQTSLFPKLKDKLWYEVLGIIPLTNNKDT